MLISHMKWKHRGISLCTIQRLSICDSKSKIHYYCKFDYIKHTHKRIKGYDKLGEKSN